MTHYSGVFGEVQPLLWADLTVLAMALTALVLNGVLLLITLRRRHRYWGIDSVLITIVASLDGVASLFMAGGIAWRWDEGGSILVDNGTWCRLGSVLYCAATVATLVFTALLALVRYLALVRQTALVAWRWTWGAVALLVAILAMHLARALSSELLVVPSGLHCTPQFWGSDAWSQIFGVFNLSLMIAAIVAIPLCYSLVTLQFRRKLRRQVATRRARMVAVKMLLVIVAYPAATVPELLLAGITRTPYYRRTSLADACVVILYFGITLINALFTLNMHHDSQRELKSLMLRCRYRVSVVIGQEAKPTFYNSE